MSSASMFSMVSAGPENYDLSKFSNFLGYTIPPLHHILLYINGLMHEKLSDENMLLKAITR